jgi:Cytochrome c3
MRPAAKRLAVVVLPVALLGAAAATKPFPHKKHVEEQEIPCQTCHDVKATEGLPKLKTKGCAKCHEDGPPAYTAPQVRHLANLQFPHAAHAQKVECAECHKDVIEDRHAAGAPLATRAAGEKCHEEKKVVIAPLACERCHGKDLKRVRPADHDGAWPIEHGKQATWRVWDKHGKTCSECHRPTTCTACHDQQRPRDHTGLWRERAHGLMAQ